jgi:hypothetical protein
VSEQLREKPTVEINQTKESLKLLEILRQRKALDSVEVPRKRDQTCLTHHVAEKFDRSGRKGTFCGINGETIVLKNREKLRQVIHVFL